MLTRKKTCFLPQNVLTSFFLFNLYAFNLRFQFSLHCTHLNTELSYKSCVLLDPVMKLAFIYMLPLNAGISSPEM